MSPENKSNSLFETETRLIFHGAHHKMGTVWMMRVLEKIAATYGLTLQKTSLRSDNVDSSTDIVFAVHSQLNLDNLGDFVGSHMIRDPRDVIVSGYFYHLWTDEDWAHQPQVQFENLSYQQHLGRLDQDSGLSAEIDRFAESARKRRIGDWDFSNPRILEMRYEELIADEQGEFEKLFRHYGFQPQAVKRCLEIADTLSFRKVTRRRVGDNAAQQHLRSGKPGQWKDILNQTHIEQVKRQLGDLLIKFGYETDGDW